MSECLQACGCRKMEFKVFLRVLFMMENHEKTSRKSCQLLMMKVKRLLRLNKFYQVELTTLKVKPKR